MDTCNWHTGTTINVQMQTSARPRLKKKWGVAFLNFDCITCIYFNCIQHAMFTICLLFSSLTKKR